MINDGNLMMINGGSLKYGYPSILDWDSPWHKPSSYWGSFMTSWKPPHRKGGAGHALAGGTWGQMAVFLLFQRSKRGKEINKTVIERLSKRNWVGSPDSGHPAYHAAPSWYWPAALSSFRQITTLVGQITDFNGYILNSYVELPEGNSFVKKKLSSN